MLGLNQKLSRTRYLRQTVCLAALEPRMFSLFTITKHKHCQTLRCTVKPNTNTSFVDMKRVCLPRALNFSSFDRKVNASLNEELDDLDALQSMMSVVGGKVFKENEAEFHHQIMENCSSYSSTIFKRDPHYATKYHLKDNEFRKLIETKNWEDKSATTLAATFASFGVHSNLVSSMRFDDERIKDFLCAFVKKCPLLNDDELIDCLIAVQYWSPPSHVKEEQFLRIWKALDQVCLERYIDWSHDKNLYVMDLWYQMKLSRLSYFVFKAMNKVSRKCEDITKAQMVQILFYMSCTRKLHPAISMREYEYNMEKYITHMSIGEIGIFALAFFKTKTAILNQKLLVYTMQRAVEEIDSIHQITLTAIAKAIRFSHKPAIGFTSNDFVNRIVEKKMDSLELINAIHILHITTQVQFYNPLAITKLAEKFYHNPSQARLKDIERVAFILSLFNFIPPSTPDILDLILDEIEKPHHQIHGEAHHLTMLSLVYFLTLLNKYPDNLIKKMINDQTLLKRSENKFLIPMQAMQIDFNRAVEGPPGSQYLLSTELREYLARRYSEYVPDPKYKKLNKFEDMMLEVMDLSKQVLGGEKYCLFSRPLPHFGKPDILFHLDDEGNPLEIPEDMRSRVLFEDVIRAPDPKGWFCVVIGGRNMYMHNLPRLTGEQVTKHRQLKLLGYNPITLPNHYWRGEKNKLDYLKLKYFTRTN